MHRNSLQVQDSFEKLTLFLILIILFSTREKLEQLLKTLNLPSEAVQSVTQAYFSSPQVSLLSLLLLSFSNTKSTSSSNGAIKSNNVGSATNVPSIDQEDEVEAKLCRIEGKYEKILQQVCFSMHTLIYFYYVAGRREEERGGEITTW